MKFNKKILIMIFLGIMLCAAGYVSYNNQFDDIATNTEEQEYIPIGEAVSVSADPNKTEYKEDYFKTAKINKETERAKAVDMLNATINSSDVTPEAKSQAETMLNNISKNIEIEMISEEMIKSKGYTDAVVYISDSSVNAVVKCSEMTAADSAKIHDIIFEQTGNNNIKIVAVE